MPPPNTGVTAMTPPEGAFANVHQVKQVEPATFAIEIQVNAGVRARFTASRRAEQVQMPDAQPL
jgi:hypothetical protein